MRPISRRRVLQLGGLGLLGTVAGSAGLLSTTGSRLDGRAGASLSQPEVLQSAGGRLAVELEAGRGVRTIAGRRARALGYNGGLPGPTLRVRPGDRLAVRLVNRLDEPTNLHVHGLVVSPSGHGDNVFVSVAPGESFDYDHQLPDDHPPGVFWYHPHEHGLVADQVFGGLYGAIVVEDPDVVPATRERVLVVSDITLDGSGELVSPSSADRVMGREGELVLVNGQLQPTVEASPGDRERWRIVNACSARYLRLRLDGLQLDLLGIDSGRSVDPRQIEEIELAPGNRADVLVTMAGQADGGTATLRTAAVDRGGMGGMMTGSTSGEAHDLVTVRVRGTRGADLAAVPARAPERDLRGAAPDGRRRLVFAAGMGGMGSGGVGPGGMDFTIDGREFDPDRTDQTVQPGAVEEWTLVNSSPMDHPVHLHVWPMQVVTDGGGPVPEVRWRDVVNVPAGAEVTVRVAFDRFAGRTVYHCHILDHEDAGMMGVVDVRAPG